MLTVHTQTFSYADQVSIGNDVLIQGSNKLMTVEVINVSSIIMQGQYSCIKLFLFLFLYVLISKFEMYSANTYLIWTSKINC